MQFLCESALLPSYMNLALPNLPLLCKEKNSSCFALQATTFPLFVNIKYYSTNSLAGAPTKGPVIIYKNANLNKLQILQENKNKAGVYR